MKTDAKRTGEKSIRNGKWSLRASKTLSSPVCSIFHFSKKSVQDHREARICCRYSHIRSNCMRKMKNPSSVSSSDLCIELQRLGGVHHSVSLRLRFITQLRPDHLLTGFLLQVNSSSWSASYSKTELRARRMYCAAAQREHVRRARGPMNSQSIGRRQGCIRRNEGRRAFQRKRRIASSDVRKRSKHSKPLATEDVELICLHEDMIYRFRLSYVERYT